MNSLDSSRNYLELSYITLNSKVNYCNRKTVLTKRRCKILRHLTLNFENFFDILKILFDIIFRSYIKTSIVI